MRKFWKGVSVLLFLTALSFLIDDQIYSLMVLFQNPFLDKIMFFFSSLGGLAIGLPFILIALLLLEANKKGKIASNLLIAVIVDLIIVAFLKIIVGRERPQTEQIANLEVYLPSFPSAHSSRAFAIFNTLNKYYSKPFLFYSIASLIAISRIYFRVHYLSDVMAGLVIGLVVSDFVVENNIGERISKKLFKKSRLISNT